METKSSDCLREILKLLQNRCVAELTLMVNFSESDDVEIERVLNALKDTPCTRNHTHTQTFCCYDLNGFV